MTHPSCDRQHHQHHHHHHQHQHPVYSTVLKASITNTVRIIIIATATASPPSLPRTPRQCRHHSNAPGTATITNYHINSNPATAPTSSPPSPPTSPLPLPSSRHPPQHNHPRRRHCLPVPVLPGATSPIAASRDRHHLLRSSTLAVRAHHQHPARTDPGPATQGSPPAPATTMDGAQAATSALSGTALATRPPARHFPFTRRPNAQPPQVTSRSLCHPPPGCLSTKAKKGDWTPQSLLPANWGGSPVSPPAPRVGARRAQTPPPSPPGTTGKGATAGAGSRHTGV